MVTAYYDRPTYLTSKAESDTVWRFLYSLLLYVLTLPLLGYLYWRSIKDPAYRQRLAERFAWQKIPQQMQGGLVVHAVSVGEVVAASPLIRKLQQRYPDLPVTVTCTTPTGSARIKAAFGDTVYHCYLPFDFPCASWRFLRKLQPKALIILETELWPNLLAQCAKALIPAIVVNARLSAKSAKGYRRFFCFTRPLLQHIRLLLAQNQATARRFRALGVQPVQVCGNLKFDMNIAPEVIALSDDLRTVLAGRIVWVVGSTHEGENEILLAAYQQLKPAFPELLLILAPRHPERFNTVATLVQQAGLSLSRRTEKKDTFAGTDVLLGDTMGELLAWYRLADIVFIGGSLIPRGGHNPLEAICFGKAVQSGPHIFNFAEAYKLLEQQQAINWVTDAQSLAENCRLLLTQPEVRQQQGAAALQLYQQQGGATIKTLAAIEQLLGLQLNQFRISRNNEEIYWWQQDYFSDMQLQYFSPAYWQQQQVVTGSSSGRNTAWFIRHNGQQMVLRHYYRGGLIGKILRDQFWYQSVLSSRAMQEFSLLQTMYQYGLPVPRPCAARYARNGFFYRADLLITLIPDSSDIFRLLTERSLTPDEWFRTGATIALFHQRQVYHSDLNCHNILLDKDGKVWLIDFDKCALRQPGEWQQQNLARLQRSLRKEQSKQPQFYWQESDWQLLLAGYQQQMDNP